MGNHCPLKLAVVRCIALSNPNPMPYPHANAIECAGSRAGSCHHLCRQAPMSRGRAQHKHTLYLHMRTVYAHPSPYTRPGLPRLTTLCGHGSMPCMRVDPLLAAARDSEHLRWSVRVLALSRLHALRGKAGLVRSRRRLILSRRRLVRQHPGGLFLRSDGTHSKTTVILSEYPAPDSACQQAN